MKLRPRKSKYLSFILILASLTVLAFGVFTLTGPVPDDLRISEPGNSGSADTLVKKKPLLTDTAFSNLLQRADILLRANKLEACLVELEKAQKLKPTDKSVNSRIVQVRGSIADSKKKQIDFQNSIVSGDAAFQKKDYLNAKAYYQLALNSIPADSVAMGKLKKTMDLIRSRKAQNTLYDVAVANADRLFQAGDYDLANEEYENASRILPSEQYPKQKINEIVKIKVEQQIRDGEYAVSIKNADQYYNAKNWQPALLEYQNASKIRPQEKYPKDRIAELTILVTDQRSKDEAYTKLITNADLLFSNKSYIAARKNYENASKIKPDQPYPRNKIIEIDRLLGSLAKAQKDYEQYISLADSFYIDKNFIRARDYYTLAINAKPGESYPKEMLEKVKSLVAGQEEGEKAREESYQSAIAIADKEFVDKNFEQAKKEYQRASDIKPAEVYPKGKIAAIDKIVADQQQAALLSAAVRQKEMEKQQAELARIKKLDDDYNLAVKKGDSLLGVTQYAQAKVAFTEAAALKPAETYPKEKLAKINTALADLAKQQELDKQYLAAITSADKLLAAKSYTEAKVQYNAALDLKPGEAYPGAKIAEITKLMDDIAKQKALDSEYAALVDSGEKLFKAKSMDQAKVEYQKALALKPDEILPKKRLTSIDSIAEVILKQKSLDEQYTGIISNADKLLAAGTYDQARSEYQKALVLKPAESYPKSKIQEIDKQLAELARIKKLDDDYALAVKKGDSLLGVTQYTQAKTAFNEAAGLKPAEAYSKTKLAQIDKTLADLAKQQALDKQYMTAITSADKLLASKSYTEAKTQYMAALDLKPGEAYPGTKIAEINKLLDDIAKQKALDDEFASLIASGETLFKAKSWNEAKAEYQKALALKPGETLPKIRITSIDSIAEAIQKQKSLDEQYTGIIGNADKLMAAKSYDKAKTEFEKSLALKPAESYPKSKIEEIDKQLAEIARLKKLDDDYALAVKKGDSLMGLSQYAQAKVAFTEAVALKPALVYPKTKISEIDKTVADISRQKAMLESNYKASIGRADQLLASRSYDMARAEYTRALGIKAGEQYPQDKIKEIDNILADLKAKDEAYRASLAKADQLLLEKKYEDARTEYENALTMRPNEQYPKNKIDEINTRMAEIQGRKKTFDDLVLKGDNAFDSRDYGKAKEYLQQATALFPDEKYAKNRLDRVSSVIDSIYRANKGKYDKAIAEADKFYNGYEFDKAIDAYTEASALLPMENYPKEMIARIHRTIAENAIADVLNSPVTIASNEEKQFKFTPVNIASRKDNFIYIKLRNLSDKSFNVLLRYGKDKQPSGGVVIRNLSTDGKVNERLISVREQDVWYRIDNDFISLYPQGGDIEVTFIQVSKAR